MGTPSSANLRSALTDETGSGAAVFATSPTLVTPALGTPASGVLTNVSGTASSLTAGNVTTNANLTGVVTSTGNATAIADKAIGIAKLADGTDGELITWNASGVIAAVAAGNADQVLTSNGAGAAPTFQAAAGTTLSGSTNNTVATVTGANALIGEANLTFDGTDLTVSSGNVIMGTSGKGIDFAATGGGTGTGSESELLADYEHGTFSPVIKGSGGSTGTWAQAATGGTYTKVGNRVMFQMRGYMTNVGSWSGNAVITGLPFTCNGDITPISIAEWPSTVVDAVWRVGFVYPSAAYVQFGSGNYMATAVAFSEWVINERISIAGQYLTDA